MSAARIDVEAFSLSGGERSFHYERDHDLFINTKAASQGGTSAALVLVELGIDGYDAHRVRLDYGLVDREPDAFYYDRHEDVRALTDAIETLTALRDRLATMLNE